MEDKIIELADYFISESTTYRHDKIIQENYNTKGAKMEAVEIVRIKDVIIEKVSANDEELKRIFGCSKRQAGERRREMQKLPSQQKHLLDSGQLVTIKGFYEYLQYRGTKAWKKEMETSKKMRSAG
ncbi:hypothetical protein IPP31_00011 [Streptococcus phage IPP31]|uniref:Uncharacterized protein n=13 Tax=root TaxID=1 RepID=A0A1S5SBB5_9CAUD|nr:hypothetical protein IPP31_00011 [Streptococcus phage IPP31]CMW00347.1 Uncharacterised protein [Streptococcus pneumoniae]